MTTNVKTCSPLVPIRYAILWLLISGAVGMATHYGFVAHTMAGAVGMFVFFYCTWKSTYYGFWAVELLRELYTDYVSESLGADGRPNLRTKDKILQWLFAFLQVTVAFACQWYWLRQEGVYYAPEDVTPMTVIFLFLTIQAGMITGRILRVSPPSGKTGSPHPLFH